MAITTSKYHDGEASGAIAPERVEILPALNLLPRAPQEFHENITGPPDDGTGEPSNHPSINEQPQTSSIQATNHSMLFSTNGPSSEGLHECTSCLDQRNTTDLAFLSCGDRICREFVQTIYIHGQRITKRTSYRAEQWKDTTICGCRILDARGCNKLLIGMYWVSNRCPRSSILLQQILLLKTTVIVVVTAMSSLYLHHPWLETGNVKFIVLWHQFSS